MKISQPVKYPAQLLHSAATKGCDLLTCDIESVVMKILCHFSVSLMCAEALTGTVDFTKSDNSHLRKHVPARWLELVPGIEGC